jgi:DNA repair photolyase
MGDIMKKNMYVDSVKQWNPFVGCCFDCLYCKTSFQRQAKRQKQNCMTCYRYEPHEHPERLGVSLPKTRNGEFIFTCANSDISFCPTEFLKRIVERIDREMDKTFLIQSKNPKTFDRVAFSPNVILGITIETNRDALYQSTGMSKAPPPSQRFADFLMIKHARKMVTVEPVLQFDLEVMVDWIKQLRPIKVWLGYDSKKNNLPEPELSKVMALKHEIEQLGLGIEVKEKKMREAVPAQAARPGS